MHKSYDRQPIAINTVVIQYRYNYYITLFESVSPHDRSSLRQVSTMTERIAIQRLIKIWRQCLRSLNVRSGGRMFRDGQSLSGGRMVRDGEGRPPTGVSPVCPYLSAWPIKRQLTVIERVVGCGRRSGSSGQKRSHFVVRH